MLGALGVLSLFAFGMLGYLSETWRTFFGKTYEFDIYGRPHRAVANEPETS